MLAVTFLLAAVVALTSGQTCMNGQEYNYCGSPCTNVCWDRSPVCIEVCEAKCQCPYDRPYWHALYQKCYTDFDCDADGLYDGMQAPAWGLAADGGGMNATTTVNCSHCMGGSCGWDGKCEYGCADGFYGTDCSRNCSSNCLYQSCDQDNGYCIHGCVNGTDGPFCEDYCDVGCYNDWGECVMDDYDMSCSWDRQCYDCKCQGEECVYDGHHSSSATVLISSTLLLLFTVCSINMLA